MVDLSDGAAAAKIQPGGGAYNEIRLGIGIRARNGLVEAWPAQGRRIGPSIPQRLSGGERMGDAGLRLFVAQQVHEFAPLEFDQPVLVDEASRIEIAAAQHTGNLEADLVVVGADEA